MEKKVLKNYERETSLTSNLIDSEHNIYTNDTRSNKSLNLKDDESSSSCSLDSDGCKSNNSTKHVIKISMRQAAIIVFQICMGVGAFSLPQACTYVSLFFSIVLICLYGLFTLFFLNMLAYTADKHKIYEYSTLTRFILGRKTTFIFNLSMLISMPLVIISFMNIVTDIVGQSLFEFFYHDKYDTGSDFIEKSFWADTTTRMLVIYGMTILFFIPFCLKKQIGEMTLISTLGSVSFLYIFFVLIIQFPQYYNHYKINHESNPTNYPSPNWFDIRKGFNSKLIFFTSNATLMYTFDFPFGMVPVYKSLKENSIQNLRKLNFFTIIIGSVLYIMICIFGFLTSPINPNEMIIFRNSLSHPDLAMTIGKLIICFSITGEVCVNFNVFRLCFFQVIRENETFTTKE